MKPLKIYFVIDRYSGPTGGTERQLYLLAEGLITLGHNVRMFVLRHTPYTESESRFPCTVECLGVDSMASIDTARKMWRFRKRINQDRPDVVHAFFNDSAILVPIYCKAKNTRVFTSRRDMGYWYTRSYLWALRIANHRVNRILCNSSAVANEVTRRENPGNERVAVIYNACPLPSDFGKTSHSTTNIILPIAKLINDESSVRICLVANLRRIKQVEDLISAADIVRKSVPNCSFWIAGEKSDPAYCNELEQLVDNLMLADTVFFLPEIDRPTELMRQCQIGALTSASEGFSNTVMEYMACGIPVVCSNAGGNVELVRHGKEGYLYQVGAVSELANYIITLANNPGLLREMGKTGRNRAGEFSRENMINRYCEQYYEHANSPLPPTATITGLSDI